MNSGLFRNQYASESSKIISSTSLFPGLDHGLFFLDLEDLRVVHAVWHFSSISKLKTAKLDDDSFIESTWQKESLSKKAVQIILSGLKVSLPEELEMRDRFGIIREKGRIKWWTDPKNKPFSEYLLSPMYPSPNHLFPNTEEVKHVEPYPMNGKPVFSDTIACHRKFLKLTGWQFVWTDALHATKALGLSMAGRKFARPRSPDIFPLLIKIRKKTANQFNLLDLKAS